MVLHKLLLEPYRERRFQEGWAKGFEIGLAEARAEADEEWRPWYYRMKEAEARGKDFDEPPPGFDALRTDE